MKKINNKGFTLIELMAVVIVLIIIIFIAVGKINESTKKTKQNTIKANALTYIKAVNAFIDQDSLSSNRMKQDIFNYNDLSAFGVDVSGTKPNNAIIMTEDFDITFACIEYSGKSIIYQNGNYSEVTSSHCLFEDIANVDNPSHVELIDYTGGPYTFNVPNNGFYKFELWGAKGGYGDFSTPGAYTSGVAFLKKGMTLYVYVGGQPTQSCTCCNNGGYNGGGNAGTGGCSSGGGGATDVRLKSGSWDNEEGLKSRIMVAAGAGGTESGKAGVGGGINGSENNAGTYATQTSGSAFGYAVTTSGDHSGAGGGYWGGANPTGDGVKGGGGSSYVSGHNGCIAILSSDSTDPKCQSATDISCSYHYSGIKFYNTNIISGDKVMPTHDGTGTMTGNLGNGYAKISY